jgi:hypothetical protein
VPFHTRGWASPSESDASGTGAAAGSAMAAGALLSYYVRYIVSVTVSVSVSVKVIVTVKVNVTVTVTVVWGEVGKVNGAVVKLLKSMPKTKRLSFACAGRPKPIFFLKTGAYYTLLFF